MEVRIEKQGAFYLVQYEPRESLDGVFATICPKQHKNVEKLITLYFEDWDALRVTITKSKEERWRVSVDTDYERFTSIENNLVDAIKNLSEPLVRRKALRSFLQQLE